MTTKFKDSGVLSGEGCHVQGAEFPNGGLWCILTRSAVAVGMNRAPCSAARTSGWIRGVSVPVWPAVFQVM